MRAPPTYKRASSTPTLAPIEDQRGSSTDRGYGAAWRVSRRGKVKGIACVECLKAGLIVEARQLDHVKARRRGGLDHDSNYQPLCDTCHSRKTATHDGGFGNATK